MKTTELRKISAAKLVTLKRNPQYQTPAQMDSLKASIKRDGFCAPILVRPITGGRFEIISGNHRFMAATEIGMKEIPCVVCEMDDKSAARLAINLNTIHGEPNAELLAPFLAELDEDVLREIHLEDSVRDKILEFDKELHEMLSRLEPPAKMNKESMTHSNVVCVCAKCGGTHVKKKE